MVVKRLPRSRKCLDFNVKVLKIVGLWPYKEKNGGWTSTIRFYFPRITLLSTSIIILSKCIDSIFIDSSLNQVTEHVFMSLLALMSVLKNGTLIYRATDLENLIMKIEKVNKSELATDRKQLAIHNQHQRYAQILTKTLLTLVFFIGMTVVMAPLTTDGDDNTMPHKMYLPYNHTLTPYYELTYAWLAVAAMTDGYFIGICDTLFFSLLISVIGQYKVLQYKMVNIRENAVKKVMSTNENILRQEVPGENSLRYLLGENIDLLTANRNHVLQHRLHDDSEYQQKYRRDVRKYSFSYQNTVEKAVQSEMENYVRNIVEHHKGITSMVDDIESIFGTVLLYQFVPSLFFLCNVAFKVARASKFDAQFIALLQLLFASIIQLFLFCWLSSTLTEESTKLNEALYHCNWLKSSVKFKKSIQLILLKANKPIHLNAAGFVHVSLELFRNVLKTSYSFYTLLNQLDSSANHDTL